MNAVRRGCKGKVLLKPTEQAGREKAKRNGAFGLVPKNMKL